MHEIQRRALLKGAAAGALAFSVDGVDVLLTPRAARAQDVRLRTLSAGQAETLDAVGETLVPGARQAGISHFVDQQISIPAEEALLQARILNVRPPYANFYRAALAAVIGASERLNGARLCTAERNGAAQPRGQYAPEQGGGLAGAAGPVRIPRASQRCGRCRVRDHGWLCPPRYPVHGAYRPDAKVVTR